jgi:peptidoglycan/LPS O-acetylase OafA/YrhL
MSYKQKNYFQQLDAVRGILAIIVYTVHLKAYMSIYLAYTAMHIFFILSVFLVSKSLLSDIRKDDELRYNIVLFTIKRIGRIAPTYFLYIFIILFAWFVLHKGADFYQDFKQFGWMHFAFVYNFRELVQFFTIGKYDMIALTTPHLWSVSFEIQLYIFIFIFIYFFTANQLKKAAVFFLIIIPILRVIFYYFLQNHTQDQQLIVYLIQRNPIFHLDIFFYGVLLVFVPMKNEKLIRNFLILSFIILISIAFMFPYFSSIKNNLTYFDALHQDRFIYSNFGIFYIDILINIFTYLLIGYLINFNNQIKLFQNRILIMLGEYSYVIYIFQMLLIALSLIFTGILLILKIPYISKVLFYSHTAIVIFCTTFFTSKLIHKKIELPLLNLKDKWIEKFVTKHHQKKNNF